MAKFKVPKNNEDEIKKAAVCFVRHAHQKGELEGLIRTNRLSISGLDRFILSMGGKPHFSQLRDISKAVGIPERSVSKKIENSISSLADQLVRTGSAIEVIKRSGALNELPVHILDLNPGVANALDSRGILTFGDLSNTSVSELMSIKRLGKKSLNRLKEKMEEFGISLKKEFGFLEQLDLSPRARNIIKFAGIRSLDELTHTEELRFLALRGSGQKIVDEIKEKLKANGLSLKNPEKE